MRNNAPSVLSLVLIPALITLAVSLLRLLGEVQGWGPAFVFGSPKAGGGGALLGIFWLALIFGFWFGRRLRQTTGEPPRLGKATLLFLLGTAIAIGGSFVLFATGIVKFPQDGEPPAEPAGGIYWIAVMLLGLIPAFYAWPRLALTLLVYAFLARIPVIIITWLCLEYGWDTHYTAAPPNFLVGEGVHRFIFFLMPQITLWPVVTILFGGVLGCLGAAVADRRR